MHRFIGQISKLKENIALEDAVTHAYSLSRIKSPPLVYPQRRLGTDGVCNNQCIRQNLQSNGYPHKELLSCSASTTKAGSSITPAAEHALYTVFALAFACAE